MTIQQAVLPHEDKMKKLLGEHFVLYRPKDIVSGDFYWVEKIGNEILIVVADCTGHGIPGAFMTLIGDSLLDRHVKGSKITEPATILQKLHDHIYRALKQEYTNNNYGMDAVILSLQKTDVEETKIVFSGAKNPLYYIDIDNPEEVVRIKGSRKAIGGYQNKNNSFENKEVILKSDSLVYLASDGYKDQNDIKRRRIGEIKFREVIKESAQVDINQQQAVFEQVLDKHMIGIVQRDDILILGIKV